MSKKDTAEDLLGKADKPAKAAAKKTTEAKAEKPAKAKKEAAAEDLLGKKAEKPAKAAKEPAADKAPRAKRVKEPVKFEEGEKEALMKRVKALVKKPTSSKDLATKMEIATRKLRPVLYAGAKKGLFDIKLEASRVNGMTVSPAAKAAEA